MSTKRRMIGLTVAVLIFGGGVLSVAHAVDGVFLITQNLVNGSSGFPYTITAPGSYRLASNLVVPLDPNTTAIVIQSDNVTLDLNGFEIVGPIDCTGTPPTCAPNTGIGSGVDASAARNVTVLNGTVKGFRRWGVRVGAGGTVRGVRVLTHGGHAEAVAIQLGNGSLATENVVIDIRGEGIFGESGNTMTKNTVTNVGPFGSCLNTGGAGGVGGTISHNTCHGANSGVVAGPGHLVIGNSVTNATGAGLSLQPTTGYAHNVLNNPTAFFGNVSGGVNMGHNVCGNALCP